jgi:hypothetical protein
VVIRRRDTATVRLPPDLAARAKAAAEERGTTMTWLVARLVREGLDAMTPGLTLTHPDPPPYRPRREWIGHMEEEQRGPDG